MHDSPVGGIRTLVTACGSKEIIGFISKQGKEVSFTFVYIEMQLFRVISSKI